MSKEQTPITARVEWLSKRIDLESIPNAKELIAFQIKEAVLEALEVVKTLTDNNVEVTSKHIESLIKSKTKI
jgi:hypothetical protein